LEKITNTCIESTEF